MQTLTTLDIVNGTHNRDLKEQHHDKKIVLQQGIVHSSAVFLAPGSATLIWNKKCTSN